MACPHFFEGSRRRHSLGRALLAACLLAAGACATVRPEDKEFLADPAMTYGGGEEVGQQAHVLSNREGALPGTATSGGGCGCN